MDLLLAIETDQTDSITYLLDKGAKVNGKNSDGLTPLMRAAEKGDVDLVRLLLERAADPGIQDKLGRTAVTRAQHDQLAVVDILSPPAKPPLDLSTKP